MMPETSTKLYRLLLALTIGGVLVTQFTLSFHATCWINNTLPPLPETTKHDTVALPPRWIPLRELSQTHRETSCPSDQFRLVEDSFAEPTNGSNLFRTHYRIPKIIHVTTKSRCLPTQFATNLQLWKDTFPMYTFVLHNDAALERLLFNHSWPEFPHLQQALQCSISMAAKADLWRALVLWQYGGVYTDIDNAPRKFGPNSIAPTDEAWFVVEEAGYLSQYFMATTPRHPLMYLLIQMTLHRLYNLRDVDHQYVPFVTGPGALKEAFLHYQHKQGPNNGAIPNGTATTSAIARAGIYNGLGNSTVTVVGRRSASDEYIARNVVYKKRRIYQSLMNMTHFSRVHSSKEAKAKLNTDSCLERLWWNLQSSSHLFKLPPHPA